MARQKSKRQCNKCKVIKPLDQFDSYNRHYGIAYKTICKDCLLEIQSKPTILCIECGENKQKENFYKSPHSHLGYETTCKLCRNLSVGAKERSAKRNRDRRGRYTSDINYKLKRLHLSTKYRRANREKVLLQQARIRARRNNMEFNLVLEDINIPEICPILSIPLSFSNNKRAWDSPSLDRVDNSKGYTKDNTRVISMLANHMKAHATKEQLLLFAKNIQIYLNNMI